MRVKSSSLPAGARVRVRAPMHVPEWSDWDPCPRTSNSVKRRIREQFFKGDRRIQAEVVYITSESMRERLRREGRIKIQLRDPAGSIVVVLADPSALIAA